MERRKKTLTNAYGNHPEVGIIGTPGAGKVVELTGKNAGTKTIGIMVDDDLIIGEGFIVFLSYMRNGGVNPEDRMITLRDPEDWEHLTPVGIACAFPGDVIIFNSGYARFIQDVSGSDYYDNDEAIGLDLDVFEPDHGHRHDRAVVVLPKKMLGDAFPVFRLPESMRS